MGRRADAGSTGRISQAMPVVDAWLAKERERRKAGAGPMQASRREQAAVQILAGMLAGGRRGSDATLARAAVELADELLRHLNGNLAHSP